MSDDIFDRIAGWCLADPTLTFVAEGPAVDVAGDPPLRLAMTLGAEEIRLTRHQVVDGAADGAATEARALVSRRGSLLHGTVEAEGSRLVVTLEYPVYLDGLTRQNFLLAAQEMAAAVRTVAALGAATSVAGPAAAGATRVWQATHEVPRNGMPAWAKPDPSATPVAQLAARVRLRVEETRGAWARVSGENGWTGWVDARRLTALTPPPATATPPAAPPIPGAQPVAGKRPAGEPATAAPPAPEAAPAAAEPVEPAPWQATHQAPSGGLPAWASPDPSAPPMIELAARTELRVEETRGAWARVSAGSGWTGWVDARRLGAARRPLAAGGLALRPLPLIGAAAVLVATFLNWVQGGSSHLFNIGLPFLWGSSGGPDLGIFTLLIGLGALALALLPRALPMVIRVLGLLVAVIVLAFVIQMMASAGDMGFTVAGVFTDGLSLGPYFALGGAILLLLARRD